MEMFIYLPMWLVHLQVGLASDSPILIVSLQEVHDLLSDYELKYCFVDKYKGTGLWAMGGPGQG